MSGLRVAQRRGYKARMVPKPVEEHPPCEACEALPAIEEYIREHFGKIPDLTSPQDLDNLRPSTTDRRHQISVDDLLATYHFRETVQCSMPQRHPHENGYVVRTRCGTILALGSTCGRKLIDGFARVESHVANAHEYHRFADDMRRVVGDLRSLYEEARERQGGLNNFRRFLQAESPMLVSAFKRMFAERLKLSSEEIPPGVELWDFEIPEVERFKSDVERWGAALGRWAGSPPALAEQKRIRKEAKDITERVRAIRDWALLASRFVTRNGITTAIEIYDSDWAIVQVDAFDVHKHETVERRERRFKRVRETFRVTNDGIVDLSTGRVISMVWGT